MTWSPTSNGGRTLAPCLLAALLATAATPKACSAQLVLTLDVTLDSNALLMPASATYGRAINGVSFQTESLLTHAGYQYATWYHNGANEDAYLARRDLAGGPWQIMDTGVNFTNGDGPAWDAHNVLSMGVSGDGRVHLAWDMHGHTLRYMSSQPGAATGVLWDSSIFDPERSSLNPGGASISTVTYPMFVTDPATGDMHFAYRTGGSGAGDKHLATYDAVNGLWNAPHEIINGTSPIFYDDPFGSSSTNRNAYLNGIDVDAAGRLHTTWTWRESAGGTNHDILYAYSDDGGDTWRNNAGAVVGTAGSPIDLNSPGVTIASMDRGNTLMNQQTQTVDLDGRVHTVMWHKMDDAPPVNGFTTGPSAYFHYFRDPASGQWTRTQLPATRAVGSRPDMAHDEHGNLYVAYVSPGQGDAGGYYTNGDLVIASASKATGYEDWEIVYADTRDFAGEPRLDQRRLADDGVVSLMIQENDAADLGVTGTPLHVLEWDKLANLVVWTGDDAGVWRDGGGADWDNDNDDIGDAPFAAGYRAVFDDGAEKFAVTIDAPVVQGGVTFKNSPGRDYAFTGAGINGLGGLNLTGGGEVTLANGTNLYLGDTNIHSGSLNLAGSALIAGTRIINVAAGARLNVAGTTSGAMTLIGQQLNVDGQVVGNLIAADTSTVMTYSASAIDGDVSASTNSTLGGAGAITGNLSATSGAVILVGAYELPTTQYTDVRLIDDFEDGDLSEYVHTIVNDGNTVPNVSFAASMGGLQAAYAGTSTHEQTLFLRDDVGLAVGEMLIVDVAMAATSQQMDMGLAVSSTGTPPDANDADADTRDEFEWASVSIRPNQDGIRVNRSVGGAVNTTSGALSGVPEDSIDALYLRRNSDTQYTLGYTDAGDNDHDASTFNFSTSDVGAAIGFYADMRTNGHLGLFDNLRIVGTTTQYVGETLTVDGDAVLGAGTALALNVYSPEISDVFSVAGNLIVGGRLHITMPEDAPAPVLGDTFEILQFGAAAGGFDDFALPVLADSLAWNVSNLLVSGTLEVVEDVDLDNDGDVDGTDFLAIQRTNPALIAAWRTGVGNRLVTPGPAAFAVPEPSAMLLPMLAAATMIPFKRVRRRPTRRVLESDRARRKRPNSLRDYLQAIDPADWEATLTGRGI